MIARQEIHVVQEAARFSEKLSRVFSQRDSNPSPLSDINSSLQPLDLGHIGLGTAQPLSQLGLRDAAPLANTSEVFDQRCIVRIVEALRHWTAACEKQLSSYNPKRVIPFWVIASVGRVGRRQSDV